MADFVGVYVLFAIVILVIGALVYTRGYRHDRRNGARLMLASPVWPLALVVALGVAVPRVFRDAFSKE